MKMRRVVPNIARRRLEESVRFYTNFLNFKVAMDINWIVMLYSPTNETPQINLLRSDNGTVQSENISFSIEIDDVDKLYQKAIVAGYSITHPLTTDPWGVRRLFVVAPNGVTVDIMTYHA